MRTELALGAVFVDDAVLALLGLSLEQALGHGWLDAIHPDDRPSVALALEDGEAPDEAVTIECRIVRGGVDERPLRIRAVPVHGDDRVLSGYLASLEDLTIERENAQAVARLSELADVLDEWILIADPDLRLRYANPAARNGLALPALDGSIRCSWPISFPPIGATRCVRSCWRRSPPRRVVGWAHVVGVRRPGHRARSHRCRAPLAGR